MVKPVDYGEPVASFELSNLDAIEPFINACVTLRLPFSIHLQEYATLQTPGYHGELIAPRFVGLIYTVKEIPDAA